MNLSYFVMLPLQFHVSQFWKPRGGQTNEVFLFVLGIGILTVTMIIVNLLKKK